MSERHFRRWDMAAIAAFLLLCGTVYSMAKHPVQWDQNSVDIADLKPRVANVEAEQKLDRAVNQAQMTMIIREFEGLHRDFKRYHDESRAQAEEDHLAKG